MLRGLFPSVCVLCAEPCEEERSEHLCPACLAGLRPVAPPVCARCGLPLPAAPADTAASCAECRQHPPPFERHQTLFHFEAALAELVHRTKINRDRLCLEALRALWRAAPLPPLPAETGAGIVIPVAAHPHDVRARGFDVAFTLARDLARQSALPFHPAWLVKARPGRPQKTLRREERLENVRGLFAASEPFARAAPPAVLLVDDIYTTGATMRAAAGALRERSPQTRVFALSLACVGDEAACKAAEAQRAAERI